MAGRKQREEPEIEVKDFTISEIDAGTRKLRRRIEEVQGLASQQLRYDDARVETATNNIREAIREVFGQNSPEFRNHRHHNIWHGGYNMYNDEFEKQDRFRAGIDQSVLMMEGLIARLEEKRSDLVQSEPVLATSPPNPLEQSKRVFVVHGHDEAAKHSVARFLQKLNLEPIILSERPNEGRTIIEKFEANADVGFAVVILTPDDIGYAKDHEAEPRPRARQNVILELGYFVAKLGRAKVAALHKGSTELPSDFHGVVYIQMDDGGGWTLNLARELKASGMNVDLNSAV